MPFTYTRGAAKIAARLLVAPVASVAGTLMTDCAHAELRGTASALPANESAMLRPLPGSGIQVRSTVDTGGTTINEYATRDGFVFAYTWQGPTMPDLTLLLGRYAEPYRAKAGAQLDALGHLHASRVEQPDVIVESGGQMRSYVGRAWLPAALPPGVSVADLN
jgi:hypothetical protein